MEKDPMENFDKNELLLHWKDYFLTDEPEKFDVSSRIWLVFICL